MVTITNQPRTDDEVPGPPGTTGIQKVATVSEGPSAVKSPIDVRLVVGEGTHAGVSAEIRVGLYLIGRHQECQIRPKSQSVSDRHCLVQHQAGTARVIDLGSEFGTYVKETQLAPMVWTVLNHGDRLRCGKYWFDVVICDRGSNDGTDDTDTGDDLLGDIKTADLKGAMGVEADRFDDSNLVSQTPYASNDLPNADSLAPSHELAATGRSTSEKRTSKVPLPKPKIKRFSSSSSLNAFSLDVGADGWKIAIAGILAVSIIGYVGLSIYRFQKGAPAKVVRGLD